MSLILAERRRRRGRRTPPHSPKTGRFMKRGRARRSRESFAAMSSMSSLGERRRRSYGRVRRGREDAIGLLETVLGERRARTSGRFARGPAGAAFKRKARRVRRGGRKVARRARRTGRKVARRVRKGGRKVARRAGRKAARRVRKGVRKGVRRARRSRGGKRAREILLLNESIFGGERRKRRSHRGRRSREAMLMERTLLSERKRRRGRRHRSREWGLFDALPNQAKGRLGDIMTAAKEGGLVALGLFGTRAIGNLFQKYIPAPASVPALSRWWGVLGAAISTGVMLAVSKKWGNRRFYIYGAGVAIIQKVLEALNIGSMLTQVPGAGITNVLKSAVTGEPLMGLAGYGAAGALGAIPHTHDGIGVCTQGCATAAPMLQYQQQPCGACGPSVAGTATAVAPCGIAGHDNGLGVCTQGCATAAPMLQYQQQPCGACGPEVTGTATAMAPCGISGTTPSGESFVTPPPAMGIGESLRGDPQAMAILASLNRQYAGAQA